MSGPRFLARGKHKGRNRAERIFFGSGYDDDLSFLNKKKRSSHPTLLASTCPVMCKANTAQRHKVQTTPLQLRTTTILRRLGISGAPRHNGSPINLPGPMNQAAALFP